MQRLEIVDDTGDGAEYDAARAACSHVENGWIRLLVRRNGTDGGEPIVLLASGVRHRMGLVMSLRLLLDAAALLRAKFPECSERREPDQPVGTRISGVHRGIEWQAQLVERMYLVQVEGLAGQLSIAGSEAEARGLGQMMIDKVLDVA